MVNQHTNPNGTGRLAFMVELEALQAEHSQLSRRLREGEDDLDALGAELLGLVARARQLVNGAVEAGIISLGDARAIHALLAESKMLPGDYGNKRRGDAPRNKGWL